MNIKYIVLWLPSDEAGLDTDNLYNLIAKTRHIGRKALPRYRLYLFLLSTSSRPALGFTQPHIQWIPGVLSTGVKRPGREAGHSPPASAEVNKMWIYTFTPTYDFMA
jgi:hypothetical protein